MGKREIIKKFCEDAIKNGYNKGANCAGWDWIRDNLTTLDFTFDTDEYKNQKGFVSKCMTLILSHIIDADEVETDILRTAWYLNNEREHDKKKKEYALKMAEEGYIPLTAEVVEKAILEKKKIEVKATASLDWMSASINNIYKPSKFNGCYGLLKPKARSRGYRLSQFENAFCKLV